MPKRSFINIKYCVTHSRQEYKYLECIFGGCTTDCSKITHKS